MVDSKLGKIPDSHFEGDYAPDPEGTARLWGKEAEADRVAFKKRVEALGKPAPDAIKARAKTCSADLARTVAEILADGITTPTGIARRLTERGIPTTRGAAVWQAVQVQRLLATIDGATP